jgi:hypothetical protein
MIPVNWQARDHCAQAKHPNHKLCRFRMSNGALHAVIWCFSCQHNVTALFSTKGRTFIPRAIADEMVAREHPDGSVTWDNLPIVSHEPTLRVCYMCGQMKQCEDHHTAEQAIYRELSDRLPIVALCTGCHSEITRRFVTYIQRSA